MYLKNKRIVPNFDKDGPHDHLSIISDAFFVRKRLPIGKLKDKTIKKYYFCTLRA